MDSEFKGVVPGRPETCPWCRKRRFYVKKCGLCDTVYEFPWPNRKLTDLVPFTDLHGRDRMVYPTLEARRAAKR